MRYQNGDRVVLLENMSFKGGGKGEPIASAEILSYNRITEQYKISYEVFGTGEKGEIEVSEERLVNSADDAFKIKR
jgi:hypothetical protein